ncbi:MAG: TetR/AcrR family transcriptional regulator [Acidimicrobiales bacterium]
MVAAAYRLFCENGYLGTTMTAVAAEANVAVQTLYYTFHTKAQLFGEAVGAAVVGFDEWHQPSPEPIAIDDLAQMLTWWDEFESAPDSAGALNVFVHQGVDVLERVAPLVAALHGSAGDPDVVPVLLLGEERRVGSYRAVVRTIAAKQGGLRRGLTIPEATDVLLVLFSAELYQALASGRGWPRARCERFFSELLATQLL